MTKVRPPISAAQAMRRVMGVIDTAEIARLVDRSERTIHEWSDPDTSTSPTHHQAIALDRAYLRAGGEGAPFHEHHGMVLELDRIEASQCAAELLAVGATAAREGGEAIEALMRAVLPGATVYDNETARRELTQAISALTAALGKLPPSSESLKPLATDTG